MDKEILILIPNRRILKYGHDDNNMDSQTNVFICDNKWIKWYISPDTSQDSTKVYKEFIYIKSLHLFIESLIKILT